MELSLPENGGDRLASGLVDLHTLAAENTFLSELGIPAGEAVHLPVALFLANIKHIRLQKREERKNFRKQEPREDQSLKTHSSTVGTLVALFVELKALV